MPSHLQRQHPARVHAPRQAIRNESLDLPDLRILPIEALVLHEFADYKRVRRLEDRVRADGFLKNPPIVAAIPSTDRFVVLDGANRTTAMEALDCPHVLVQVVDYKSDQVHLQTWHHLITGRDPQVFLEEIADVEGLVVQPVTLQVAREGLALHQILAYIVLPPPREGAVAPVYLVDGIPGTEHHGTEASTRLLNDLVDTYKGDPQVMIHRAATDEIEDLMDYYDDVSGLVIFPAYTPDDILKLAETGGKVPTGITRHIINHRALRVNIPLSLLAGKQSLDEKNAWWHEQVKRKLADNEIRVYQESTYLFDE